MEKRKILALGAHDDDVLIGIGGILLSKHANDEIKIQIFTNGENSHLKVLGINSAPTPGEVAFARRKELEKAYDEFKSAGLNLSYDQWNYPDTCGILTDSKQEVKQKLALLIDDFKPHIVYFQSRDAHEDHRLVHIVTKEILQNSLYVSDAYSYTIWTKELAQKRPEVDPNLIDEIDSTSEIIDIKYFVDIKRKALFHFKSQIDLWPYLSWQPQNAPILDAGFIKYFLREEEIINKLKITGSNSNTKHGIS